MYRRDKRSHSVIDIIEAVESLEQEGRSSSYINDELGLSRYDLSHMRRLSKSLTGESRYLIRKNDLSEGHAKALSRLSGSKQEDMLRDAIRFGWSVRKLEARISEQLQGRSAAPDSAYYDKISVTISEAIGHPVKVKPRSGSADTGDIIITYLGFDSFDSIMERLRVRLED